MYVEKGHSKPLHLHSLTSTALFLRLLVFVLVFLSVIQCFKYAKIFRHVSQRLKYGIMLILEILSGLVTACLVYTFREHILFFLERLPIIVDQLVTSYVERRRESLLVAESTDNNQASTGIGEGIKQDALEVQHTIWNHPYSFNMSITIHVHGFKNLYKNP